MSGQHRAVAAAGLASAVLGAGGILFAVFGPMVASMECTAGGGCGPITHHSLLNEGIEPGTWFFLLGVGLVFAGIAGTALGYHRGARQARWGLWLLTLLLVLGTWVSLLSIGWLLMPAAFLALVASGMARR